MVDTIILFLALTAGAVAFFSACSAVVLPAYLTHYFGKDSAKKPRKNIAGGFVAGLLVTAGFLTVFGVSGMLLTYFGRGLVAYVPWLTAALGVALIAAGALMLAGRTFIPVFRARQLKVTSRLSFYNFGLVYGLASFGCSLPVFLSVLSLALAADAATGFLSFVAYALGMGLIMLAVSVAAAATKGLLARKIASFVPVMKRLSAVFVIIVGIYLIYFQMKAGLITW